jgi:hemerythrin
MKLMQFRKELKIGIQIIDDQHENIIQTVNHIYDIKNHEKQEILESFSKLIAQLKDHFEIEENLMNENKVIHSISHKLEHDRAFRKYSDYYNVIKSGKTEFDAEILISLKEWIESHLIKKDMKLKALNIN